MMEIIAGLLITSILATFVSLVVHRLLKKIFCATIISILLTPIIFHFINRALDGYPIDYPDPIESFILLIVVAYSIIPCIIVAVLIKKIRGRGDLLPKN
jgi:hypothetical protein